MDKRQASRMVIKATRYAFDLMVNGKADPDNWFRMHTDFKTIRENALRSV